MLRHFSDVQPQSVEKAPHVRRAMSSDNPMTRHFTDVRKGASGDSLGQSRPIRKQYSDISQEPQPPGDLDKYLEWSLNRISGTPRRFQLKVMLLLSLCSAPISMHTFTLSFVATEPDIGRLSGRVLLSGVAPANCSDEEKKLYGDDCPELSQTTCGPDGQENRSLHRSLWTFRDPQNSATADLDMSLCSAGDRWRIQARADWMYDIGYFAGALIGGMVCNWKGPRFTWFVYLSVVVVGQVMFAGSPNNWSNYWSNWVWFIGRGLGGAGAGGLSVVSFIWAAELADRRFLPFLLMFHCLYWVVGGCAVGLVGRLVLDWRTHSWILGAAFLPLVLPPFLVFESPKWLAFAGHTNQLLEVIKGLAEASGQPMPPLPGPEPEGSQFLGGVPLREDWRWMFHRLVLQRLLVLLFIWASIGLCFFSASRFQAPPAFTTSYISWWSVRFLLELPSGILAAFMVQSPHFGRVGTVGWSFLGGNIALLLAAFGTFAPVQRHYLFSLVYILAQNLLLLAYLGVHLLTLESIPNAVRGPAMGICIGMAHLGSWAGGRFFEGVPPMGRAVFMAIPAVLAVLLVFQLPETLGKPLPGYTDDLAPIRWSWNASSGDSPQKKKSPQPRSKRQYRISGGPAPTSPDNSVELVGGMVAVDSMAEAPVQDGSTSVDSMGTASQSQGQAKYWV